MDKRTIRGNYPKHLKISEAARFLGFTKQTLRNWDESGVLHPDLRLKSGYRLYSIEKLKKFMEELGWETGKEQS